MGLLDDAAARSQSCMYRTWFWSDSLWDIGMLTTPRKCKTQKPRRCLSIAVGNHNLSRWAGYVGLIGFFLNAGTEELLCQVVGSDRVMSVECNVWCCGIMSILFVFQVWFFFFLVELIPGWLHGLNACLCWNMLFALLVSHLRVQFSLKGILFVYSRTASWYAVSRYNKEACLTHVLLVCTKNMR